MKDMVGRSSRPTPSGGLGRPWSRESVAQRWGRRTMGALRAARRLEPRKKKETCCFVCGDISERPDLWRLPGTSPENRIERMKEKSKHVHRSSTRRESKIPPNLPLRRPDLSNQGTFSISLQPSHCAKSYSIRDRREILRKNHRIS